MCIVKTASKKNIIWAEQRGIKSEKAVTNEGAQLSREIPNRRLNYKRACLLREAQEDLDFL